MTVRSARRRVPCAARAAPRRAAPHSDTHTLPHPAPITDAPRCRLGRVCCTRRAASALCSGAQAVIRPCVALRFGPPRVARWWLQALGSHLCAPPLRSSPLVAAGPLGSSASLRLALPASPERRCLARGAPAARLKGAFFLSTHVFVVTPLSFVSNFSLSKKLKGRSLRRFEGYSKKRSGPGYGGRDEPKTSRWPLAWLSPARPPASLLPPPPPRAWLPWPRGGRHETTREREQMPAGAIDNTNTCGNLPRSNGV